MTMASASASSASVHSNTLPLDDLELELEETEGLIELSSSSTVGRGGGRRKKASSGHGNNNNAVVVGTTCLARMCSSSRSKKWTCCALLVLAVVLLALWMTDTNDLEMTEGEGGSHVSDVQGKTTTSTTTKTTAKTSPPMTATNAPTGSPTEVPEVTATPPLTIVIPKTVSPTMTTTRPPTASPTASATTTVTDHQQQAVNTTEPPPQGSLSSSAPPSPVTETTPSMTSPPNYAIDGTSKTTTSSGYAFVEFPYAVRTENPPSPHVMEEYAREWGTWQLDEWRSRMEMEDRPAFCRNYSHCDVPSNDRPQTAWQANSTFVNKFLDEADTLVHRAMNAILAEYGKVPTETEMFDLTFRTDLKRKTKTTKHHHRQLKGPPDNGGWTTKQSMEGLSRRLLHAIVTQDTFTLVMGGHSAAAGHGNHFKQSYAMQFHKIMEPVFSYLGVTLISRNMAQGGLGTAQAALGAADIYGDEIDFMVWDSGMTEGRDGKAVDLFGRQALLGNRVPVLWNLNEDLLEMYHEQCDADVGSLGSAELGIPVTKDEVHAETLPFAVQYFTCDEEHKQMCRDHKYRANCWVERPDVSPPKKQNGAPGGQASWHPGFRWHQITGRILAYTILIGLKEAIGVWKKAGTQLPDEAWHVSSYYDNIQSKVMGLDADLGSCGEYNGSLPERVCRTQMRGRTEFTPRANPEKTSIRSILKTGDYKPTVTDKMLYDGPDVRNPMFDIPPGEVDVVAILNNGRTFPEEQRRTLVSVEGKPAERQLAGDEIVPGKGYMLRNQHAGYCDGSYNAICGRAQDSECLLYGHHDGRSGLFFHEYSGWIVMELPKVMHGIIMIKIETWHWPEEVEIAEGWTTVNNERSLGAEHSLEKRRLKRQPPEYCDDFHFDFSVDGKLTSYNVTQFKEAAKSIQRVVEVVTLLDDSTYVKEGEQKNVEVAIRMRGCGNQKVFSLTHVYWA